MINFPKESKNEAIINQYKTANKELDQLKILQDAKTTALALVEKANNLTKNGESFNFESFKESTKKQNNSVDTLESRLQVISDLKSQFAKKGILTNDIPNIEKYGNEKVQSQGKSMESDILNRKPGYTNKDGSYSKPSTDFTKFKPSSTPNVSRPTSSGQKR